MTIEECYATLGGNYQQALGRLMNDALIKRFVLKFPSDKSYDNMVAAINARDTDTAFREAHTLKGVCRNLAFDRLDSSVSEITEHLRSGDLATAVEMLPRVTADYQLAIDPLRNL